KNVIFSGLYKSSEEGMEIRRQEYLKTFSDPKVFEDEYYVLAILVKDFPKLYLTRQTEKLRAGLNINAEECIYFGYDGTFFNSGKEGFVITEKGIYYKSSKKIPVRFLSLEELRQNPELEPEAYRDSFKKLRETIDQIIYMHSLKDVIQNVDVDSLCSECGGEISANTFYCPHCGSRTYRLIKYCG
ncbi:MAG: hypothetical protein IKJ15_01310, partial [Lachnospiraceae bacterium]|nr:hypothetical protein [Lachnospiraceae bacterium]